MGIIALGFGMGIYVPSLLRLGCLGCLGWRQVEALEVGNIADQYIFRENC